MKKRLFMIIAIMTIVAMAVVGLVACDGNNNNGGGNSGGENNGGGNNGGGNVEETPITETAGLNINNLRTELENKTFTLKVEEKEITDGNADVVAYVKEYEPTKSKTTYIVDGVESTNSQYLYQLGNKFIIVGTDLSVRVASFNDGLVDLTMFIAPNAEDLFEIKDGKYSIKNDKYEDYYKKLSDDEELPDEAMWNTYKQIFASMRIEFKADSISINFSYVNESTEVQNSYNFTKIGSTTVTIPQELLDLPVHGIKDLDAITRLNKYNYSANIKTEKNGTTEEMLIKYYYDFDKTRLSYNINGSDDMTYIWQDTDKYYMAQQSNGETIKSETSSSEIQKVVNIFNNIIYRSDYFELKDGKYMIIESEIDDYIRRNPDLMKLFKFDVKAIKDYVKSIEITFGNEITLSYTRIIDGETTKTTLTVSDFHTTTVSVPDSIINMPVTEA